PSLEVVDNQNFVVKGLDAIKKIQGNSQIITDEEKEVSATARTQIAQATDGEATFATRKCKGGKVSTRYLDQLGEFCTDIIGDLTVQGLKRSPRGIQKLEKIKTIKGRLVVKDNTAVKDLSFLSSLQEISNPATGKPSLEVVNNLRFVLRGLKGIRKIHGNVYVKTEEKSDVPSDVKQHITSITDGKATFLVKEKPTTPTKKETTATKRKTITTTKKTTKATKTEPRKTVRTTSRKTAKTKPTTRKHKEYPTTSKKSRGHL
ncbi:receptor L domain protein, partial [Ostertagia ostertagi]